MTRHSKKLKRGDRLLRRRYQHRQESKHGGRNWCTRGWERRAGNRTEPNRDKRYSSRHTAIDQQYSQDNKSLKEDLAHLKSSFSSQAQDIKKLKESLETYKNENAALKNELETTKESLAKQIDELGNVYDQLDE